jgi:2-polyprenyl-3-methyl-5-hydroxy-6-metoxy-1,4-benzoquinol methylase
MSLASKASSPTRSERLAPRVQPVEWEEAACSLCGSRDYRTLLAWRDAEAEDAELRVVQCRKCSLAFTNPRPTPETIGRFYPTDYSCYELRRRIKRHWRARWRAGLQQAVLRSSYQHPSQPADVTTRILGRLGRALVRDGQRRSEWIPYRGDGQLLDFGCGAGEFLERMRDRGWKVEGLDMSTYAAHVVMRERGIRVHVGTLPHRDLAPETFDCITMWQALEHVHEPRVTLREARRLLRPGGVLTAAVPNFSSWPARQYGRHWFALDVPRHLTHFTPQTLRALFEAEGFRPIRLLHAASDGWLRQSARRATSAGLSRKLLTACRWKPLAQVVAAWTERTGQADNIILLAERD